ncbi:hypothetical protein HIM_06673 [Hirsutella minnesotensis 3608]|uniref:BRCT domain-containing protein n=1 Tax=Hirsutella minnesotensis 3608 TaxID=1043627 RepID=A0A0F7ZNM4_9HYPO|nr:hypothetical protein HIM_06673 [Hirsutella minnesotensis 3608]
MTRPASPLWADKMGPEGISETQDSQAIFDAHQALFGVGSVNSSPGGTFRWMDQAINQPQKQATTPSQQTTTARDADGEPGDASRLPQNPSQQERQDQGGQQRGKKQATPDALQVNQERTITASIHEGAIANPPANVQLAPRQTHHEPAAPAKEPGSLHTASPAGHRSSAISQLGRQSLLATASAAAGAAGAAPVRMDTSQQTPTQVNEDRDYTSFCGLMPSSPGNIATQQNTYDEPRTLKEDDTGAVNFGIPSDFIRPSSQVSEDAGFDTTRSGWRASDRTSQLQSNAGQSPYKFPDLPPETPALPKNPFAARVGVSAPLAGTQLFGNTQQPSSASKISPTSSRPSPNLFLNSISPNVAETSPLKNRANVSSPTDIRTSSPPRLNEVPGSALRNEIGFDAIQDSPIASGSPKDDLIPESPTDETPKPVAGRQVLAQYEPMKQSQQRKSSGDDNVVETASEAESDDAFQKAERRKRAERKRARAAEALEKVSFAKGSRPSSADQPNKKKRRVTDGERSNGSDLARASDGARSASIRLNGVSPKSVDAIPDAPATNSAKATPAQSASLPAQASQHETAAPKAGPVSETVEEEMIPATSPVVFSREGSAGASTESEPELPALPADAPDEQDAAQPVEEASSLPPVRRRAQRTYGTRTRQLNRNPFLSSSTSDVLPAEPADKVAQTASTLESPVSTASTSRPPAEAVVPAEPARDAQDSRKGKSNPSVSDVESAAPPQTRSRASRRDPLTPLRPHGGRAELDAPSSSLSTLSTSPAPPSKEPPRTQESTASNAAGSVNLSISASSRNLRKRAARMPRASESPHSVFKASKPTRRSLNISDSPDELNLPVLPWLKGRPSLKSFKSSCQSINSTHRARRLFENMAFALSSQSEQPEQQRVKLETQIVQAGGSILKDGFQELFEPSSIMTSASTVINEDETLQLPRAGSGFGFTALIADGHSRKPKYMQALALGLPCLGRQWITACLNKGEVVDWEPFLLCAGSSAVLGNAIRSRVLRPYPAVDAQLADVIDRRRKLLEGQSILVVFDAKKGRKETKQQYMFLIQALGPFAISRVSTVRQARDALAEQEQAGRPFDWLYVDKSAGSIESILTAPPQTLATKQRRRTTSNVSGSTCLRVLTDELVIQSLILGRMVEHGEVDF